MFPNHHQQSSTRLSGLLFPHPAQSLSEYTCVPSEVFLVSLLHVFPCIRLQTPGPLVKTKMFIACFLCLGSVWYSIPQISISQSFPKSAHSCHPPPQALKCLSISLQTFFCISHQPQKSITRIITRVPQGMGWCKGGNRNVVGRDENNE